MSAAVGWPYPTVPVDGTAQVDEDGENQTCACGNDSMTQNWCHATRDGQLRWMPEGSVDPEEFAVCPICGRVYPNAALFTAQGGTAAACARYDDSSTLFRAAVAQYERAAYGGVE